MDRFFFKIMFFLVVLYGCSTSKDCCSIYDDNLFAGLLESSDSIRIVNEIKGNFGDSKLVKINNKAYVIATLSGQLQVAEFDSSDSDFLLTNPSISSNWLATINDGNNILCVTASFKNKSLRLYRINIQTLKADLLAIVEEKELLMIDPTLIKVDSSYFITYTQIEGNINNSDTSKLNGHYKVVLMESKDLKNWDIVSHIVDEDANIEDGSIYYNNKSEKFYFMYEEEIFDKMNSFIKFKKSTDRGKTWSDPIQLLSAEADQEPAGMFFERNELFLLYSSDIEDVGSSYYGAKGFISSFSIFDFKPIRTNVNIKLDKSIVLYDVMKMNNNIYFLAERVNLSGGNSIVEYRLD